MKTTPLDLSSVPLIPEEVTNLTICTGKRKTCCTTFIEDQMKVVVKQKIENKLQDQIFMLRDFFERHLLSFKQQLREQIFYSKEQLNQMFIKTYGPFYKSNIKVFDDLYTELDNYLYANTVKPIPTIVEKFFEKSYLIIFELLNPLRKVVTNEQRECLLKMKKDLKPFSHFPKRISGQLGKSFTVWRSFFEVVEGIVTQLHSLLHTSIPEECVSKLVEMQYCQTCTFNQNNLPGSKPCYSYCSNVLKGCLAEYAEIDTQWNVLIDSLLQLFTKLKDVSNPITTLAPIPAQISEGFMVYQERGAEITNRIVLNCFDNYEFYNIGRIKRDMTIGNGDKDDVGVELTLRNNKNPKKRRESDVVTRMIETFGDQLKRMKDFWRTLPESLCDDKIASKDDQFCWNGREITPRYRYKVIPYGIRKQKYNPEFLSQRLYLTLSRDTFLDQRIKFVTLSNTLNKIYKNAKSDDVVIEGSGDSEQRSINIDDEDDGKDVYEGSAMEIENEILNDIRYLTMDDVKSAEHTSQGQNTSSEKVPFFYLLSLSILTLLLSH
uniref:Glypican-6-like n=1 Tax=Strongyloides papillosus TaxID=174720 RepID=A0A0N5CDT8_STREA